MAGAGLCMDEYGQRRSEPREAGGPQGAPGAGKRIVVLSSGNFSGATVRLVEALKEKGAEVERVRHTLKGMPGRWMGIGAMALHAALVYRRNMRRYINRTATAAWVRSRASGHLLAPKAKPDAILLIQANFSSYFGKRPAGVRLGLVTDHFNRLSRNDGDGGFRAPESRVYRGWLDVERRILEEQDRIFVFADYVRQAAIDGYGIGGDRVLTVGAGPNVDVDAERDGIAKDYGGRNILFVGVDAGRKGLPLVLRAFGTIRRRYPDARLDVAGSEGRSGGGIRFHGRVEGDALKRLFYAANILVLPSYREPFGIVLLEAMMAKAVCVGTRVGGIGEVVEDDKTGYLIDTGSSEQLADRIIALFENPTHAKTLAENGYHRAKTRYGWGRAADRILRGLFA
jgi:glycosyltransferase involved in cell wall biosynthesis